MALYQAGETLYQLFDKVILIDQGKCLYYGPTDRAKQYFIQLGFECPDRWTTADFLTSVSDKHERSVREGWEERIPRSADDFAAAYLKSDISQLNLEDIADFEQQLIQKQQEIAANQSKKTVKKNYTIPFQSQVWACTLRQFQITWGDKASVIGKWGGIVFQVCAQINELVDVLTTRSLGSHRW